VCVSYRRETTRIESKEREAKQQVRIKESQLAGTPEGTMSRDNDRVRPSIKKTFDMPIPEDL
jgi:hypothetical protein